MNMARQLLPHSVLPNVDAEAKVVNAKELPHIAPNPDSALKGLPPREKWLSHQNAPRPKGSSSSSSTAAAKAHNNGDNSNSAEGTMESHGEGGSYNVETRSLNQVQTKRSEPPSVFESASKKIKL